MRRAGCDDDQLSVLLIVLPSCTLPTCNETGKLNCAIIPSHQMWFLHTRRDDEHEHDDDGDDGSRSTSTRGTRQQNAADKANTEFADSKSKKLHIFCNHYHELHHIADEAGSDEPEFAHLHPHVHGTTLSTSVVPTCQTGATVAAAAADENLRKHFTLVGS